MHIGKEAEMSMAHGAVGQACTGGTCSAAASCWCGPCERSSSLAHVSLVAGGGDSSVVRARDS